MFVLTEGIQRVIIDISEELKGSISHVDGQEGKDLVDYQKMYATLFHAVTKAITLLQQAQQETEEMYISAKDPAITIWREAVIDNDIEDEVDVRH